MLPLPLHRLRLRACTHIPKVLSPASGRNEWRGEGEDGMALPVGTQFRGSVSLSSDSYHVTCWRILVGCAVLAAISLVSFNLLANCIEAVAIGHGFRGSSAELVFDLRFCYTPDEAWSLLERWAPEGRQQYLMVETIDCLFYHTGYRGAGLVMINRLEADFCNRWPILHQARHLAALPFPVASLDFFEDLSQV